MHVPYGCGVHAFRFVYCHLSWCFWHTLYTVYCAWSCSNSWRILSSWCSPFASYLLLLSSSCSPPCHNNDVVRFFPWSTIDCYLKYLPSFWGIVGSRRNQSVGILIPISYLFERSAPMRRHECLTLRWSWTTPSEAEPPLIICCTAAHVFHHAIMMAWPVFLRGRLVRFTSKQRYLMAISRNFFLFGALRYFSRISW